MYIARTYFPDENLTPDLFALPGALTCKMNLGELAKRFFEKTCGSSGGTLISVLVMFQTLPVINFFVAVLVKCCSKHLHFIQG